MLDVADEAGSKGAVGFLPGRNVEHALAGVDKLALQHEAVHRVFRTREPVAFPRQNNIHVSAADSMADQRFQAGAVHVAAADGVVHVDLGERPTLRLGKAFELLSLLVQAFFLAVGRAADVSDGGGHE
ncbi:MAG TPA: hypothetical protein VHQ47_05955 [Phycisphaerae bacterium]|nr:hypothetical protein [Phycisphaerae bacterium]